MTVQHFFSDMDKSIKIKLEESRALGRPLEVGSSLFALLSKSDSPPFLVLEAPLGRARTEKDFEKILAEVIHKIASDKTVKVLAFLLLFRINKMQTEILNKADPYTEEKKQERDTIFVTVQDQKGNFRIKDYSSAPPSTRNLWPLELFNRWHKRNQNGELDLFTKNGKKVELKHPLLDFMWREYTLSKLLAGVESVKN